MTATFNPGDRILSGGCAPFDLPGRYVAESFPPGEHVVQLDCGRYPVRMAVVRPMSADLAAAERRAAASALIVADA